MKKYIKHTSLTIVFLFVILHLSKGNISLPEIFTDNMVLQQSSEISIWGWAKSGETIVIKAGWMENELSVRAGNQGTWKIVLKTPSAGGPYDIHLKGYNEIVLRNVLIGEVWICSGQSNMEWSAQSGIINGKEEIENASYPEIRLFTVYQSTSLHPQDHFTGEWKVCTPETMRDFSAVAYFFARRLHKETGIPVGLINSSWGGTPAEAWMPEEFINNNDFLKEASAFQKPVPWGPVEIARIYNSMINPMINFRIAGVIWYQGESNTINGYAYKEMLSGLITSWRGKWGYDFPFYYAQIAPYRYGRPFEGAVVRDAQRRALDISNTGMVVLSDIGDTLDIHPKNKVDVGTRLANLALNRHYKVIDIEDSGPLFKEMVVEKSNAIISFDHNDGLHVAGDKLNCFEIAGEDKVFYPADAKIKGNQVVVQSKKVKIPVAVRFAWSNTATPNLFNGANLPASCFISE